MFIYIPKIHFIIHFFLEILHFKESCNLIGWQHFGPQLQNQNFARYGIGREISTTILLSILDYFQEKLRTKYFKKSKKPLFWGSFWAIFAKICPKVNFPGKMALSVFRYSNYLPSCQNTHKNNHFCEKCGTDIRTDRQTT